MGIFNDAETSIQEGDAQEIVQRVSEDLLALVKRKNIALEIDGTKIKLLSESRTMLEITCEATNAFRLNESLGNHSSSYQMQATSAAPRWSRGDRPYTQSEMVVRVKTWLNEQRG